MEKDFAPYEEALALKEIGFDEPCLFYYYGSSDLQSIIQINMPRLINHNESSFKTCYSAPSYSQAFRWFRKKYGYDIHIKGTHFRASYVIGIPKEINMKAVDGYPLVTSWDYIIDETGKRKTYEEAELECLKKLIEIQGGNK